MSDNAPGFQADPNIKLAQERFAGVQESGGDAFQDFLEQAARVSAGETVQPFEPPIIPTPPIRTNSTTINTPEGLMIRTQRRQGGVVLSETFTPAVDRLRTPRTIAEIGIASKDPDFVAPTTGGYDAPPRRGPGEVPAPAGPPPVIQDDIGPITKQTIAERVESGDPRILAAVHGDPQLLGALVAAPGSRAGNFNLASNIVGSFDLVDDVLLPVDIFVNELTGGEPGTTISSRVGEGTDPLSQVIAGGLNLIDPGHTDRARMNVPSNFLPRVPKGHAALIARSYCRR